MEIAAIFAKLVQQTPTDTRVRASAISCWIAIKETASVRSKYYHNITAMCFFLYTVPPTIIISDFTRMLSMNLDGSGFRVNFGGQTHVQGLDFDYRFESCKCYSTSA